MARLLLRVTADNTMLSASSSAATASLVGAKKVPARLPVCIAPCSADACMSHNLVELISLGGFRSTC